MASLRSLSGGGAALLVVACISAPIEEEPRAVRQVNQMLAGYAGKQELSQFVGTFPDACLPASGTRELCQWQAGDRQPGWTPLAQAIGTDDRINLLCELPTDGGPRAADACTVHPRRSNRYSWKIPRSGPKSRSREKQESPQEVRDRYRRTVERWMAESRTLVELSRLMGAVPDECTDGGQGQQMCLWRTSNQTYGHGTLAVWIDAPRRYRIRLRCLLPVDGGNRAPGSCTAFVGA